MKYIHTTHWVLGALGSIMIIGATASLAQGTNGLSASVLSVDDSTASAVSESLKVLPEPITPTANTPEDDANSIHSVASPDTSNTSITSVASIPTVTSAASVNSNASNSSSSSTLSSCPFGTSPVIEGGRLVSCTAKEKVTISSKQLEPDLAKKIKIPDTEKISQSLSCESKGLFTYTGDDLPGLLYGKCIPCEMKKFNNQNRSCKK